MNQKTYINKIQNIVYKDLSTQEVIDYLNEEMPIKLIYNEELINRIYNRYPNVSKKEITIVVKTFFKVLREKLLEGRAITLTPIFGMFRTYFSHYTLNNKTFPSLKMKLTTDPKVKKPNVI